MTNDPRLQEVARIDNSSISSSGCAIEPQLQASEPSGAWRPTDGRRQNDPAGFVALVQANPGFWTWDFALKYLNITIDMRAPAVFWLADRDGNDIHPQRVLDAIARVPNAATASPAEIPSGDTPWKRFRDEVPVYDGSGERHLLTWSVRVGTYDVGCIDGNWDYGEAIDGHPDDLWRWLDVNPERHTDGWAPFPSESSDGVRTMSPQDQSARDEPKTTTPKDPVSSIRKENGASVAESGGTASPKSDGLCKSGGA